MRRFSAQSCGAALFAAPVLLALTAGPAAAHAFGARYDLPLPLWLYVGGAGAAVTLSFLVMALFVSDSGDGKADRRLELSTLPLLWLAVRPWSLGLLRLVSVALFLLTLATGLFGSQSTTENFAPTFVWVIWWVGLAFFQALVGDVWSVANPWAVLFTWAEALWRRCGGGARFGGGYSLPRRLGSWPAVVLFLGFAWLELVPEAGERPRDLAAAVLCYSAVTWGGMWLFGKRAWLYSGEAFTVVFGLLARFAPLKGGAPAPGELSPQEVAAEPAGGPPRLALRPYGVGLLTDRPLPPSLVFFVLTMLATVTFDGFSETPLWSGFLDWVAQSQLLRGTLLALQGAGFDLLATIKTLALLAFPLTFAAVFALFAWLTARAAGPGRSITVAAGSFVLTLVPIAIAYHLAHYLSYLLLAGQLMIPLASDPFGWGWDLFGGANYNLVLGVIGARATWFCAVAFVLLGHIYAVYLGHVMALRLYGDSGAVLRSQIPLLVLMVGYTMVSLWILSQPIVATP